MRLDKAISNNSNFSRKEINKIIRNGQVKVNGKIYKDPSIKINPEQDCIFLFDQEFKIINYVYLLLNKPKNYVCSTNNNDGDSILNLIDHYAFLKNIHIVGRLDKDTTGLVLITNDGKLTHQFKSAKYQIEKEYHVVLEKTITQDMLNFLLNNEIKLDNKKLKPFQIKNINHNELDIILIEGKYHQVKRLFQLVNNKVIDLQRTRIHFLNLKDLKIEEGKYLIINKADLKINF